MHLRRRPTSNGSSDDSTRYAATSRLWGSRRRSSAAEDDEESYSLVLRAITPETFGGLRGVEGAPLADHARDRDGQAVAVGARLAASDFRPVSFAGITAFFAIELEAESRGTRSSMRFVVSCCSSSARRRTATTACSRRSSATRESPSLSPASARGRTDGLDVGSVGVGDTSPGDGWAAVSGLPVLESMIRALARDPERLDHVERLIKSLAASEEGRALIPDDLESVWAPIWEARVNLRP